MIVLGRRFIVPIVIMGCTLCLLSQDAIPGSLEQLFRGLLQQHASGKPPSYDDVLKVAYRAEDSQRDDAVKTLPLIMAALNSSNINLQIDASLVLWGFGKRSDAVNLLTAHLSQLVPLFRSSDERLQMVPVFLFNELRPAPPPEVVPILLEFLAQQNRDAKAQAGAIGVLVHLAPEDPKVTEAARNYLTKARDADTRILVLNALRGSRTSDRRLVEAVIEALQSPDSGVRFTTLQVIPTLGSSTILQAEPALRQLIENPKESDENKALAEQDLQQIGRKR
jgi:hypothetical protein